MRRPVRNDDQKSTPSVGEIDPAKLFDHVVERLGAEEAAFVNDVARRYPEVPERSLLRVALGLAGAVTEWTGQEEKTYLCLSCLDHGIIVVAGISALYRRRAERIWYCLNCNLGIEMEAAYWFDAIHPVGRREKRGVSREGRARFERFYYLESRILRRRRIEAILDDLVKGNQPGGEP